MGRCSVGLDRAAVAPGDASGAERDGSSALPPVLTVDEAARLLRVNRKTLYDPVRAGEVPGVVRLGRSIRIGRDAVKSYFFGFVAVREPAALPIAGTRPDATKRRASTWLARGLQPPPGGLA